LNPVIDLGIDEHLNRLLEIAVVRGLPCEHASSQQLSTQWLQHLVQLCLGDRFNTVLQYGDDFDTMEQGEATGILTAHNRGGRLEAAKQKWIHHLLSPRRSRRRGVGGK
jgi:hypothetical protein